MSSTQTLLRATVAATTMTVLLATGDFIEPIVDYTPMHPVHDIMNIAYDIRALGHLLSKKYDFEAAYKIYSQGGHSESIATLELEKGLDYFIDEGTVLTGKSVDGEEVQGVAMEDYKIGDKEVRIRYDNMDPTLPRCYVGGLDKPEIGGCFVGQGYMKAEGEEESFPYFYNVYQGNANLRNLRQLSQDAEAEFTHDGQIETGFFSEFAKFDEYYGTPTYADEILTAVFRGNKHSFAKHTYDFRDWEEEDRAWFVEHGTDYMNIAMHIVGQLEQVKNMCDETCAEFDSCNMDAIKHLDTAVAFYTGSMYNDKSEGNMLYGLADQMCKLFKTCGWSVDKTEGTSHVNLLNFVKFKSAQEKLKNGKCASADTDMRVIAKMVFVPLWQGLLWATYHKQRKEATVFASATLPILAHCSPGYVEQVFKEFLPDSDVTIHFPHTKKIIESHYHCIALDCRNMGGLWDPKKQE